MKLRYFMVCIALCCNLFLAGCVHNSNEKLSDEFNEHLKNYYEFTEISSQSLTFTSENLTFHKSSLEIEKVEYGTYHIIVTMGNWPTGIHEQAWTVPLESLKEEFRFFANTFISFAKSKDMDNDYYLYIEIPAGYPLSFVYDYEEDILYFPQKYDLYCEMYETFGTTYETEIAKSSEGLNWLLENGFGEIKHNEYESIYDYEHPGVYLNDDGKFDSYNLEWYI